MIITLLYDSQELFTITYENQYQIGNNNNTKAIKKKDRKKTVGGAGGRLNVLGPIQEGSRKSNMLTQSCTWIKVHEDPVLGKLEVKCECVMNFFFGRILW